jgi:hypothetical protein
VFSFYQDEVNDILPHLCTFNRTDLARSLQTAFSHLASLIHTRSPALFEKPAPTEEELMRPRFTAPDLSQLSDPTQFYMDKPKIPLIDYKLAMLKL